MPDRGCPTQTFVELRGRVLFFSLRARALTCTLRFLAVMAATATAACSVDLGYLDDGAKDRTDGSIPDATMAKNADDASGDGNPVVEDAAGQDDVNGSEDSGPQSGPPALLPDAGTFPCPTTINGAITSCDGTQIGRFARVNNGNVCNETQAYPTTTPDPTEPHYYHVYRFANPTSGTTCYTFTLTYVTDGGALTVALDASTQTDAGADAGAAPDATTQTDAGAAPDGSMQNDAGTEPECSEDQVDGGLRVLSIYSTFYPDDLADGFLGYSGGVLTPPQSASITVAAGGTVDVVVMAVDIAPAGTGPFILTCAAQ
jgi:hypothetical protein